MSLSSIISGPRNPESWTKIKAHRIHAITDIEFNGNLIGNVSLDNLPSGNLNDVVTSVEVAPGVLKPRWRPLMPAVIPPGTSNQIFVTNQAATAVGFSSNITVPGTLTVNGTSTHNNAATFNDVTINGSTIVGDAQADNLNIVANMQSNGSSGVTGQIWQKTAAATQGWVNPSFTPNTIQPGTANQLLVTNPLGTATVFTSDPSIPGTLTVTGNSLLSTATTTGQLNANSLSVTNASSLNGNVALGDAAADNINLIGNLQNNGVSGTNGQILQKTSATTQAWTTPSFAATTIQPGAANQVFVTNAVGTASTFSNDLSLPGNLTVTGSTTVNGNVALGDAAADNINIIGNLQTNATSGSAGQILQKTGATTQAWTTPSYSAATIQPGAANQVLVTNAAATTSQFSNDLALPGSISATGTLNITGTSSLNTTTTGNTTILGNLTFVAAAGLAGQYIRKFTGTTQTWSNILATDVAQSAVRAVLTTAGYNLYTVAATNIPFDTTTFNVGASFIVGGGGTTFTLATAAAAGYYRVYFSTNLSTSGANVSVQIFVNATGFSLSRSQAVALNASPQNFQCQDTVLLALNDVVTIKSQLIGGGGPLTAEQNQTMINIIRV